MSKTKMFFGFILILFVAGCASSKPQKEPPRHGKLLKEAEQAIEEARLAGADKECPEAFQGVLRMKEKAEDALFSCTNQEGIILTRAVAIKARALCPPIEQTTRFLDSDGDGIHDVLDQCPNDPEDFDGFEDEDGCPDLDNDQDTIPDVRDGAPNDPETFNGYKDEDGIPDRLPCRMALEGVQFAVDSSKLLEESLGILDNVAKNFDVNSELRVRIEGHTSSEAPEAYNQNLSERRAKSVKDYLVQSHSILPDRLVTIGFGERKPVATNDTEEGRSLNRRVEFVVISKDIRKGGKSGCQGSE